MSTSETDHRQSCRASASNRCQTDSTRCHRTPTSGLPIACPLVWSCSPRRPWQTSHFRSSSARTTTAFTCDDLPRGGAAPSQRHQPDWPLSPRLAVPAVHDRADVDNRHRHADDRHRRAVVHRRNHAEGVRLEFGRAVAAPLTFTLGGSSHPGRGGCLPPASPTPSLLLPVLLSSTARKEKKEGGRS